MNIANSALLLKSEGKPVLWHTPLVVISHNLYLVCVLEKTTSLILQMLTLSGILEMLSLVGEDRMHPDIP